MPLPKPLRSGASEKENRSSKEEKACAKINSYYRRQRNRGSARRTRNPAVPSSSRKQWRGTTSLDMFIRVHKSVGFAYLLPFSQLIITHDLILTKFLRILFMR